MDKLRLAACGIDCNECGQYKVTSEHDLKEAEDLVYWFRSMGWIGQDEDAEAVMKKAPLCKGCWNITNDCFWKCGGGCGLRICCEERQINHCGECGDFPCEDYMKFGDDGLSHHKKAMERLLSLRENI